MFQIPVLNGITGDCVFKFEPFVLHVQCLTIKHAQLMVSINSFEQFVLYIEKNERMCGKTKLKQLLKLTRPSILLTTNRCCLP